MASTKAFTAQVAVLAMMATDLGRRKNLSAERTAEVLEALSAIPDKVTQALETEAQIQALAELVMARRKKTMTDAEKEVFLSVTKQALAVERQPALDEIWDEY